MNWRQAFEVEETNRVVTVSLETLLHTHDAASRYFTTHARRNDVQLLGVAQQGGAGFMDKRFFLATFKGRYGNMVKMFQSMFQLSEEEATDEVNASLEDT
jgi:hypothetical protein